MKFAILINCSPTTSNTALTAYQFVKTALSMQHEVLRVFFYQEGIYHGFAHVTPPDDEVNLNKQWSALAEQHALDLVVCISAAQRRGLLGDDEASRQGKVDQDLAAGFRISGLGQLVEACILADRFMVFG